MNVITTIRRVLVGPKRPAPVIVRRFVETGDERCPLAGIWLPIDPSDCAAEDPELARPAMGGRLPRRAFTVRSHSALTF